MLISEVIETAQAVELKQLPMVADEAEIIRYINLGLLELYKRFSLKTEDAIITLQDNVSTYTLDGVDENVVMSSTDALLTILEVYDGDDEQLTVNKYNDATGVMTPSYNVIKVPTVVQDAILTVHYRAAPPFVVLAAETLRLPPQLLEALLHYVGYKGHSSIKGGIKDENNTHYIRFDASCKRAIAEGLIIADDISSESFDLRGFV